MGAVALVLLAVIVLPMVFDPEPRNTPAVSVRIPGEDDTPFKPKAVAPKAAVPKPAVKKEAETPKEQFVVPVGAFTNPRSVTAKLDAAKIPYYTEAAQGNLTRVRAGPFASREAADQALARLKELGLKPGAVTSRSG